MKKQGQLLIALLISVATPMRAMTSEPPGARPFVKQVIAYEVRLDTQMRSGTFLAFFTPRLRSAIVKDMAGPELNVIDSDFLCQCQTGVAKMHILALAGSKGAATARIESWSVGKSPPANVTWHLRRDGQSWRISDVETARRLSLLAALEESNRVRSSRRNSN